MLRALISAPKRAPSIGSAARRKVDDDPHRFGRPGLRLTTEHFMVLPSIVKATDLAVVMPRNIAHILAADGGYAIIEPPFPLRDFTVSLHWSKRFEADPANRWLLGVIEELFRE